MIIAPTRRRFLFGSSAAIVAASSLMAVSTKAQSSWMSREEVDRHLHDAWRREIAWPTININGHGTKRLVWRGYNNVTTYLIPGQLIRLTA